MGEVARRPQKVTVLTFMNNGLLIFFFYAIVRAFRRYRRKIRRRKHLQEWDDQAREAGDESADRWAENK